jgi:hypothetical protein
MCKLKGRETANRNLEYGLVKSKHQSAAQLANKIGNITAMVQIGSVGGALIAFIFADKIGKSLISELDLRAADRQRHCRTSLGHSSALPCLDSGCHYLHHSKWQLWPNPCRPFYYGPWHWSNNCGCTCVSLSFFSLCHRLRLGRYGASRF